MPSVFGPSYVIMVVESLPVNRNARFARRFTKRENACTLPSQFRDGTEADTLRTMGPHGGGANGRDRNAAVFCTASG